MGNVRRGSVEYSIRVVPGRIPCRPARPHQPALAWPPDTDSPARYLTRRSHRDSGACGPRMTRSPPASGNRPASRRDLFRLLGD